jgi:hypothetical protein
MEGDVLTIQNQPFRRDAIPITPHPQRHEQHASRQAERGHGDSQGLEHW